MALFKICEGCFKRKFFTKKREYKLPNTKQRIVSQSKLCRTCYNNIKKMVK